ncbi:hypothetical protein BC830DRAFT_1078656 [Chytriomyces sp. MP71]|nr:hypothetical protein BC830DRAFT_1078656 [Chytriomyces sp. MP71]
MTTPSNKLLLISHFNAISLACLSLAGSVMLLPLGAAIHARNIQIVGGKEMIEDTAVVSGNCFIAAVMYAGLFVFALWQAGEGECARAGPEVGSAISHTSLQYTPHTKARQT